MGWNSRKICQHIKTGKLLCSVKEEFISLIRTNKGYKLSEKYCIEFIKKAYKKYGLVNDNPKESCIVAFGKNTNQVHHFPVSTKPYHLSSNTLILLDIWARLPQKNAPYADTTFMFFYSNSKGKNQKSKFKVENKRFEEYNKIWKVLVKARDSAIDYIQKEVKKGRMPRGLDIDRVAHDIIGKASLGHGIKHTIGHSLGLDSPHGKLPGINWREYSPLSRNVGYTIEPGIYLKGFGMRTEIDFYINSQNKVIITTPVQKEIELLC